MNKSIPDVDFRRFWQRLQAMGLNAYEARLGFSSWWGIRVSKKALNWLRGRTFPRQKIYEVLDSLVEKGFARVVQEKTKLFSAVPPDQAIPSYLARRAEALEQQLSDQARTAKGMVVDLMAAYAEAQGVRLGGTLDYLWIVGDPGQVASQFRRMLAEASSEYLELSRPPYAVDPLDAELVLKARARGVGCRLLVEQGTLDTVHQQFLADYQAAGASKYDSSGKSS